jgi:putative Ca2+/H+ antiporter (TMEM165/GDT1 family)
VNVRVVAAVFPLVFLAELPDKTMFASLLLAARGRPASVWLGAFSAFAVHVVIAISIGVALFKLVPHRALDAIVAAMFVAGAVYAFLQRGEEEVVERRASPSAWTAVVTSATVIFIAEWGDLTQVLTANLAARYHDVWSVGVGSLAALGVVAAVAVIGGSRILKVFPVRYVRLTTAVVLIGLAAYSAVEAAR